MSFSSASLKIQLEITTKPSGLVGKKRPREETAFEVTLGAPFKAAPKSILKIGPSEKKRRVTFGPISSTSAGLFASTVAPKGPVRVDATATPACSPVVFIDPKVNQQMIRINGLGCVRSLPRTNDEKTLTEVEKHYHNLYAIWTQLPKGDEANRIRPMDLVELNYRLAQCALREQFGCGEQALNFANEIFSVLINRSKDLFDAQTSSVYSPIWKLAIALYAKILVDLTDSHEVVMPESIQDPQTQLKFLSDMGYELRGTSPLMALYFEKVLALRSQHMAKTFTPNAQKTFDNSIEKSIPNIKKSLWDHYLQTKKSIESKHGLNSERLIPLYRKMLLLNNRSAPEHAKILQSVVEFYYDMQKADKSLETRILGLEQLIHLHSHHAKEVKLNTVRVNSDLFFAYLNLGDGSVKVKDFNKASEAYQKALSLVMKKSDLIYHAHKCLYFHSIVRFASNLQAQGELTQAKEVLERALQFREAYSLVLKEGEGEKVQEKYNELVKQIDAQAKN